MQLRRCGLHPAWRGRVAALAPWAGRCWAMSGCSRAFMGAAASVAGIFGSIGWSSSCCGLVPHTEHACRVPACCLQTFIKVVNYQHMMPTRYTLEVRKDYCRHSPGIGRACCCWGHCCCGVVCRGGRTAARCRLIREAALAGQVPRRLPALCWKSASKARCGGLPQQGCIIASLMAPAPAAIAPSGGPQGRGDHGVHRQQHQEGGGQQGGQGAAGGEVQERQEPVRGRAEGACAGSWRARGAGGAGAAGGSCPLAGALARTRAGAG